MRRLVQILSRRTRAFRAAARVSATALGKRLVVPLAHADQAGSKLNGRSIVNALMPLHPGAAALFEEQHCVALPAKLKG